MTQADAAHDVRRPGAMAAMAAAMAAATAAMAAVMVPQMDPGIRPTKHPEAELRNGEMATKHTKKGYSDSMDNNGLLL